MKPISFKRHRFPPSVIVHAVWLYARFTLSFRDVEEMLAERGIDVSNETVRRWFLKFGRLIASNLRRSRHLLPRRLPHRGQDALQPARLCVRRHMRRHGIYFGHLYVGRGRGQTILRCGRQVRVLYRGAASGG